MKELREILDMLIQQSGNPAIIESIQQEENVFPFSAENRMMAYLLDIGKISYDQYLSLNRDYAKRNKYLGLFDLAPTTFGSTWAETHIQTLFPQFKKATKRNMATIYPNFNKDFDLWLPGIRIEVKACRANSTKNSGGLAGRAFLHSEAKTASFKYHFQQLKPSCCDVFIWIGVCRDELLYWVLTSDELLQTGKLRPQHRNENTGILGAGIFEGQVFMTEEELSPYFVAECDVLNAVLQKGSK